MSRRGNPAKALRSLLRERAENLLRQGKEVPEIVDDQKVAELERLQKLVNIYEQCNAPARTRRYTLIGLFATLSVVSCLLFIKMPSTQIQLDIELRGVRFRLAERQRFTQALSGPSSLGVSPLKRMDLPTEPAPVSAAADEELSIRFDVQADEVWPGEWTLQALVWPKGTSIDIQHFGNAAGYTILSQFPEYDPSLQLSVNLEGAMLITFPKRYQASAIFESPDTVHLWPAEYEAVVLDIGAGTHRGEPFASRLHVEALAFESGINVDLGGDQSQKPQSAVLGGHIVFVSLGHKKRDLRRGEWLEFEEIKGDILGFHVGDDQITMRFKGRVRGMSMRTGQNRRSLMPSILASLRANYALEMLWVATAWILGLFSFVFQWWGKP